MYTKLSIYAVIVLVVSVVVPAWATTWFDDFEGYTVGDHLSDYPDWTHGGGAAGAFIIADYGGSKCICTDLWPGYYYEPPGELADSRVSFDFCFVGGNTRAYASFRYNPDVHEGYIAGCVNDFEQYGGDDYLVIGYAFEFGDAVYEPFFNLGDYFEEGVWYHLDAKLWGSGEGTCYEIVVNGDVGVSDSVPYGIPERELGYCGVAAYSGPELQVCVDNYEADDEVPIGIQPTSLGAIKSVFK